MMKKCPMNNRPTKYQSALWVVLAILLALEIWCIVEVNSTTDHSTLLGLLFWGFLDLFCMMVIITLIFK